MGNFTETSLGAPVKWALSLSMYVKSPQGIVNTVFILFLDCSRKSGDGFKVKTNGGFFCVCVVFLCLHSWCVYSC